MATNGKYFLRMISSPQGIVSASRRENDASQRYLYLRTVGIREFWAQKNRTR